MHIYDQGFNSESLIIGRLEGDASKRQLSNLKVQTNAPHHRQ